MRVRVLCEDRRAERFARALCAQHGVELLRDGVDVAPSNGGAAWVLARYAKHVRLLRSKNYQRNLGLIVHIDGDNQGVTARKTALDARLVEDGQAVRGGEPLALLVPTWSIETWLLQLAGLAQPAETDQIKRGFAPAPAFRAAVDQLERDEAKHIGVAVAAFLTHPSPSPSLADGRKEAGRVGIR